DAVGRDPQEVLAAGGLRRVRAARGADRHARAPRGARGGVRVDCVLPVLLPVPGRRRGAREPPRAARLARDVAAEHRAGNAGVVLDARGVRSPARAAAAGAAWADPGGRVKILDRYLLREFLGYLALGLAGFIVIFVVVDIFEKLDVFLEHRAPAALVMRFYLF